MPALIADMRAWADGSPYEQRAAAAALCEPRLLKTAEYARATLEILETITAAIEQNHHRKSEDFIALKKGLAYCWSVAVAALPQEGKPYMEHWLASADPDIRWIMKENLSKNRLERVDPQWVEHWRMK
jgi:hypothetical protein